MESFFNFAHRGKTVPVVFLLCLMVLLFSFPAHSFWGSGQSLDKTAQKLARDLIKTGKLEGEVVLISPQDLYDAQTHLSLPLALQLRNLLVTEMKKAGVRVLLDDANTDEVSILQGTWSVQGEDLFINLKVMRMLEQGPEAISAASTKMPLKNIDKSSMVPDKASWARYIIRQLSDRLAWHSDMTVHTPPFETNGKEYASELGTYLSGWIRPAMAESGIFRPIDQAKQLNNVNANTLRKRGTRGIRPDIPSTEQQSLTAGIFNADTELKGDFYLNNQTVEVRIKLINRDNEQISAASAEIPKDVFPEYLFEQKRYDDLGPVAKQTAFCVSGNGLNIDLTSTKGEGRPYYKQYEDIRFIMRLNRPAWVYLFDLNPAGEAILLYPVDEQGFLAPNAGFLRDIDGPLILPEDGYSYDLVADTPFGTDTVWAVASETPLDFPPDMSEGWGYASNLVARLREQGLKLQRGYAEAKLELTTGP